MSPKISTFLLLLLGSTLTALSIKCPEKESLPKTCKCEHEFKDNKVDNWLSCSGSTIEELEDALHLMDKSSRLAVLLDNMKLGYLPSRLFNGSYVAYLYISLCELNGLAPSGEIPLQGLEEILEVIFITSSFTEKEKPTALHSLAHLRRLRQMDLSHNAITELHDHWFSSPPPALSHLSLLNNGIEKLGERAFETLVNLEYLGLHGNRFGPIKRSMLPGPGNRLENLELTYNAFTSVPDDLFSDMPKLKVLSITTNEIAHLQEKAFKPIWSQLDVFDARGNPLECDSSMEWLFHVKTEASVVLGICEGPLGKEGMDLEDFIKKKGQ